MNNPSGQVGGYPNPNLPNFNNNNQPYVSNSGYNSQQQIPQPQIPQQPQQPQIPYVSPQQYGFDTPQQFNPNQPQMKGDPNCKKCKGSGMKLSKKNEMKPCKCVKKMQKKLEKEKRKKEKDEKKKEKDEKKKKKHDEKKYHHKKSSSSSSSSSN